MDFNIKKILSSAVQDFIQGAYNVSLETKEIQIQSTRKEFEGDFTIVVFPFVRYMKMAPEECGKKLGENLVNSLDLVKSFGVIKGFLNLEINPVFWASYLKEYHQKESFTLEGLDASKPTLIEFSSPNTNKPLHLGHIRNNLLGQSVANIMKASGEHVVKVNLVNDRGIHICKSMLAWQKWGEHKTPESLGIKGDKLVGDYYVRFDQEYKKEIAKLEQEGLEKDAAEQHSTLMTEARQMLRKWEANDPEVRELWTKMNQWVYEGFEQTYKTLGIDFDKIYYESNTYKLGKELVLNALNQGILVKKEDGSVWADLTKEGLDEKILLRSDGTSVYMTQDLGTAHQRFNDYGFDKHIYVVGNEQNYHFQVLSIILKKMGYDWSDDLYHLSYGMVELPEGKMKSREGTVVDADDLVDEMIETARKTSEELGKLDGFSSEEKKSIYRMIALGALKYFILKVDPKKKMLFNPKESIDFNGNTGPFVQYTNVRIKSVLRKAEEMSVVINNEDVKPDLLNRKEIGLLRKLFEYPELLKEASDTLSPALIANYVYDLAKDFNQYYHDYQILNEPNLVLRNHRLMLIQLVGNMLTSALGLLGIEVPERM